MNWLKKLFKKKQEPKPEAPVIPSCYYTAKRSIQTHASNDRVIFNDSQDSPIVMFPIDTQPSSFFNEPTESTESFSDFHGGDFGGAGSSGSWDTSSDSSSSDSSSCDSGSSSSD